MDEIKEQFDRYDRLANQDFIVILATEDERNTIKGHLLALSMAGHETEPVRVFRDVSGVLHVEYSCGQSWKIYGHNMTWSIDE